MTSNAELLVLLLRSTVLALKTHKTLGDVMTIRECEDVASLTVLSEEAERRGWEPPRRIGWAIDPYPEET